jgi:hypothetical protein
MCLNIKNFYLTAALEYFEYSQMPLSLFPPWIIKQYDMEKHALNGYIHLEMQQAVWGLPQVGILANKRLKPKLAPFGYFESTNTPGLWYHKISPITFTLVVDNFGVKYVNKVNMDHLIASIKGLHAHKGLDGQPILWNPTQLGLHRADCRHINAGVHQKEITGVQTHHTGKNSGMPLLTRVKKKWDRSPSIFPPGNTPKLDKKGIKQVKKIVGSILYYARAVKMTVSMALSTIAVNQTKATKRTMERCMQLLDYHAHNVDAKVRFHASDMILNIHSNVSYLSEAKARSRACGHFFMRWMPRNGTLYN